MSDRPSKRTLLDLKVILIPTQSILLSRKSKSRCISAVGKGALHENFPEQHPKITIKQIFDRLKPQRLQTCIQHEFVVRESEKLKDKDFYRLIGVLMKKDEVVSE